MGDIDSVEKLEVYQRLFNLVIEVLDYFINEYNICGRMLTNLEKSLKQKRRK